MFKGDFEVDLEGDFKQDLLSSSGQLRSRSGLVQVWFSIELKFNSFELDSEVGRLVVLVFGPRANRYIYLYIIFWNISYTIKF